MSRHRLVRAINYNEEYDGYDDIYGSSVDDDAVASADVQHWIYNRAQNQSNIAAHNFCNNDTTPDNSSAEDSFMLNDESETDSPRTDKAKLDFSNGVVQRVGAVAAQNQNVNKATEQSSRDIPSICNRLLKDADIEMREKRKSPLPMQRTAAIDAAKEPLAIATKATVPSTPKVMCNDDVKDQKKNLNLIVIGHVDAGKSTLMGRILVETGYIPKRVLHKYEQESKKLGKSSFMYAWILDEASEERTRGITMDVGTFRFETKSKIVTILDAPGHKDFIPNMISGATQADVALLIVDATRGEFESGFDMGGQTREHALLVRSLGINQLGVVINKLDTANWSKERFDDIVSKLKAFLKQAGYKDSDLSFIPCSGLSGENLCKPSAVPELMKWYAGPYLLEVIDRFKIPERSIDRPFRMSISDVYKASGSGYCAAGRIESGVLAVNSKVMIGVSREQATVKSILVNDLPQSSASAGDQVTIALFGIDLCNLSIGSIICDPQFPISSTTKFQARILVFNMKIPITNGYPVLLHYLSSVETAFITKLCAQIHKGTGEVIKKKPRCITNNSCALVEIEVSRPICIEKFADYKELGRFMLRVAGVTIAAGMVTKIR